MKEDFSKDIFEEKNLLRVKGNKQFIMKKLNLFDYKSCKRENNILFYFVYLLIISNLLLCILSDISIKINAYFSSINVDYPIIYVKNIGHPSEIYVDSEKIQNKNNLKYKYSNDYLYIKTTDKIDNYIIKLVWQSEISMNNTLIPDNNDNDNNDNAEDEDEDEDEDESPEVVFDTVFSKTISNTYTKVSVENPEILFEDASSEESLIEEIKEETELIQEEEYNIIPENFTLNGSKMFYYCRSIQIIDFYDFDTSMIYNMSSMFRYCTSLTEVKNLSPVNVKDMSYLFYKCSLLKKVNFIFPQSMYSNQVTDMKYMFANCKSITSIDLTNIYTNNVTNMYYMFSNCNKLKTITFNENFDVSSVTDMGYMFYHCISLASLTLINMNAISLESIDYMFMECTGLKSLNLNNFSLPEVKSMSH